MLIIRFETEQKINVIKAIREVSGLGLRDAKDMLEQGAIMESDQIEGFLSGVQDALNRYNQQSHYPSVCRFTIEAWVRPAGPVELPRPIIREPVNSWDD